MGPIKCLPLDPFALAGDFDRGHLGAKPGERLFNNLQIVVRLANVAYHNTQTGVPYCLEEFDSLLIIEVSVEPSHTALEIGWVASGLQHTQVMIALHQEQIAIFVTCDYVRGHVAKI